MIGASTAQTVVLIAVAVAAAGALWAAVAYNGLVRRRNLVREGWSGIDVQLKRRHSLIPNLVETVRAYSRHEKDLLTDLAEIRAGIAAGDDVARTADRENALTDQLKGLFALAEAFPDLKADRNYRQLMDHLADIEDQIQYARRYYNGTVRNYNIAAESFPANLVARAWGFAPAEFFQIATATDRAVPNVEMPT